MFQALDWFKSTQKGMGALYEYYSRRLAMHEATSVSIFALTAKRTRAIFVQEL